MTVLRRGRALSRVAGRVLSDRRLAASRVARFVVSPIRRPRLVEEKRPARGRYALASVSVAQMKPTSSRATAVVALVVGLPR